ncbi:MAG: DUF3604 domain-containing protein [Pseudomonadales bacterium]
MRIYAKAVMIGITVLMIACSGSDRPAGSIEGQARTDASVQAQVKRQTTGKTALDHMAKAPRALPEKQILFGDLHVHTTYSPDAFAVELPMMAQQGIHTPADACDYARYCANLDFFSIDDHAEGLTPAHWEETKKSVRQCNALAGDTTNQDVIPFIGWEWTQVGLTPDKHWGHKNVIFQGLDDDQLPTRPISSRPDDGGIGLFNNLYQATKAKWLDPMGWKDYADLEWMLDQIVNIPLCPKGVPSRDLPADCHENAPEPADLYAKLNEWGFDNLVIPHGNTWGMYTPPTATWDKALNAKQHDPDKQRLLEIMSGHGNSEEYRPYDRVAVKDGNRVCPEPSNDFLPCCWQAGEIMRGRCGDLPGDECEARVQQARQFAVEAHASYAQVFPDAEPEEWLNCGQCEDCFKPSFGMVPKETAQYAMALSNFEDADASGKPLRFRYGFIGSTDDHTSRPGTGYKQYERRKMTFASGVRSKMIGDLTAGKMDDPQQPEKVTTEYPIPDAFRAQSFTYPGGIVAAHATNRSRAAVWQALKSKEVYGTSGPRMLLWFDVLNSPKGRQPMGAELELSENPRFEVRAAGAFKQKPGCPADSVSALSKERLDYLCVGECYNPGDTRHPIVAIEVIRIRPQASQGEDVGPLIEDVWKRFDCEPNANGCVVQFEDKEFLTSKRDTLYYVRALQEETPAINGGLMRTEFDANGKPIKVDICHGDYRTDFDDECLAPVNERAWSSPIFIDQARANDNAQNTSKS